MSAESVKKTIQEQGDRIQLFMFNKRQLKLSFKIIPVKRRTGMQNWHAITFTVSGTSMGPAVVLFLIYKISQD